MSEQPICAQKAPYILDCEPGKVFWCACGRSENQPFCDGSHKGTGITPIPYDVPEGGQKLAFCGCKQSNKKPLCDGTHSML